MFGQNSYSQDPFKKVQQSLTVVYTEDTEDIIFEGYGTSAKPLRGKFKNAPGSGGGSVPSGDYVSLNGSYENPAWITSLAWSKISNAPIIPAAQVNADWNAISGVAQILNKPTVPTNNNQLTNGAGYITSAAITNKVDNTLILTINGEGYDLSQDRTWTIAGITDASLLTSGTLADARLSTNIPRIAAANTFVGNQTITGNLSISGTITNSDLTTTLGNKQNILNGSGFVKVSGTTVSYDTNNYTIANSAITGATKTKITYDAKGLVTSGADATTSDISEGSNLYYTDERAQDAIAAAFAAGTHSGISIVYDDATNKFSFTATGGAGSGDVVGGASSTDNGIVRYDGTTGKVIQNSLATIDDVGLLTCVGITSTGKIQTTLTTEQLRLSYDVDSYMSVTIGSDSTATFDLAEDTRFIFNKEVRVNGNFYTNSTLSTNANLAVWSSTAVATSNANLSIASGPNTAIRAWMRGGSIPTIAAGDNYSTFVIGTSTIQETSAAATVYPLFTQMSILALNVVDHANSSLTDYAALHIKGGITGITPTGRNLGLWIEDGGVEISDLGGAGNKGLAVDNSGKIYTIDLPGAGTGDVVGPSSATDNAIVRYDSTTGKLIQDSTVTISDTGQLNGVTSINGYATDGFVLLQSDVTSGASLTWGSITGLSFPVVAGGVYWLRFFLSFDGTATSGGVKWGISGPPSPSRVNYHTQHSATLNTAWFNEGMNAYDEGITSNGILSTTDNTARGEGIITFTNTGTAILRFASELDNGITVKAKRSVLFFRRIE